MIPQYRPVVHREKLAKEISDYILGDGYFMEYKKTQEFEQRLAEYLGVKYCSLVPNGTIALSLALLANGVRPGDYVLLPNITMMSTQSAIELIGAKPLFIDVDSKNLCMNLEQAQNIILNTAGFNIKASIYVSLNGRSHIFQEYKKFLNVCNQKNIAIIEDNAQSFGSEYENGSKISSLNNNIGCFSLSVAKSITSGQGGFMVTNNDNLGGRIKRIKDLDRENGGHDLHDEFGINAKFTEMQAIMGLNQLNDIDKIILRKKEIYDIYYNELKNSHNINMIERKYESIWFVDIYVANRSKLQEDVKMRGIGSRNIYPALNGQQVNKNLIKKILPISKTIAKKGLWLPSSLDLTKEQIILICNNIKDFYR